MFRSKWRERAEQVLQELTVAEQRIQALENEIGRLNEVHSFVGGNQLANIILDLRWEIMKTHKKPTRLLVSQEDVTLFLQECPLYFLEGGPTGITKLFGLDVHYTAGEIRVE